MTIALLLLILALSISAHEGGHALVAWLSGNEIMGIAFHPLGGVGVRIRVIDPGDVWKVAIGGLTASALLAMSSYALLPLLGLWAMVGFVLNACLLFINMIPIGPTDGRFIWKRFVRRCHDSVIPSPPLSEGIPIRGRGTP